MTAPQELQSNNNFWIWVVLIVVGLFITATFTIPKVLNGPSSSQNTAISVEVAGMIKGSYEAYTKQHKLSSDTSMADLQVYMNYVGIDSTTNTGTNGIDCTSPKTRCLQLHNGGILAFNPAQHFDDLDDPKIHYLTINLDPDGKGIANAMSFLLFGDGHLATGGREIPGANGIPVIRTDPVYAYYLNSYFNH